MTLRFCSATLSDIDEVARLDASAFEFAWSRGDFEGSFKAGHTFVLLKDDEQLLGMAVYMQIFEQAELLTIAVDPKHQGKGLGKLILNELMARLAANGAESLFLEVRVSNERARSLYRGAGFEEISRRKGYYPTRDGREDAIVMQKLLS